MKRSPPPRRKKPIARVSKKKLARMRQELLEAKRSPFPFDHRALHEWMLDASSGPPVEVSTAPRAMGPPLEKQPDALSPAYLSWVRSQPCELHPGKREDAPIGGEAHHEPPRGGMGRQVDALVVSTCRSCHTAAHSGEYSPEERESAAHRTWLRLWRLAPDTTILRVLRELARRGPLPTEGP